eukprot:Nk52_evm48s2579 gene=Nk52_evmTU48s2579
MCHSSVKGNQSVDGAGNSLSSSSSSSSPGSSVEDLGSYNEEDAMNTSTAQFLPSLGSHGDPDPDQGSCSSSGVGRWRGKSGEGEVALEGGGQVREERDYYYEHCTGNGNRNSSVNEGEEVIAPSVPSSSLRGVVDIANRGGNEGCDYDYQDNAHQEKVGDVHPRRHYDGKRRVALWRMLICAFGLFGDQLVWTLAYGTATPFFNTKLNLSKFLSSLTWAFGPITGMFVAPLAGSLSDLCSLGWGRRRPFILSGYSGVIVFSMLFALSTSIFGTTSGAGVSTFAILCFMMMNTSINVGEGPLRTILADMANPKDQSLVFTFGSLFQGAGQIVGAYVVPLVGGDTPIDNMLWVYLTSCAFIVGSVFPCLLVAKESRYTPEKRTTVWVATKAAIVGTFSGITKMSAKMLKVCVAQGLTFFAWFWFNPIMTAWFGNVVYGADKFPKGSDEYERRYNDGVNAGSMATVYQAIVQVAFSFIVPYIVRCVGMKYAYALSMIPLGLCLTLSALLHFGSFTATVMVAITGISVAGTNIFPFAIVGQIFNVGNDQLDEGQETEMGKSIGILNIFATVPQFAAVLCSSPIVAATDENMVVLIGGLVGCLSFVAILLIDNSSDPHCPHVRRKRLKAAAALEDLETASNTAGGKCIKEAHSEGVLQGQNLNHRIQSSNVKEVERAMRRSISGS